MPQIGHDFRLGEAQHHLFPPFLETGQKKTGTRGDGSDTPAGAQQFQPALDEYGEQVVFTARIGFGELILTV